MPGAIQNTNFRRRSATITLVAFGALGLWGCGERDEDSRSGSGAAGEKPLHFAFVVNNPSTFWAIAEAGLKKAEAEFGVEVEIRTPPTGAVDEQQRIIEELIAKQVDGMAISPIDPAGMTRVLNEAADRMLLITHDSDAPESKRLAYIGTDNYEAGRIAGERMKQALPGGGKIMIFVGRLDAQNARDRRQGILDVLEGGAIEVIDTRLDYGDQARAKENAEGALVAHTDLAGMMGLWSYNGPAIVSAVRDAGKVGEIKIVCFDEDSMTLQGVQDGSIDATVVQKPFEFGFQSIRLLSELARGDESRIPDNGLIDTGVVVVERSNVEQFRAELAELTQ